MSSLTSFSPNRPISLLSGRPYSLRVRADDFQPGETIADYHLAASLQPLGRKQELITLTEGVGIERVASGWVLTFTANQIDRPEGRYELILQVHTQNNGWERELPPIPIQITQNRIAQP